MKKERTRTILGTSGLLSEISNLRKVWLWANSSDFNHQTFSRVSVSHRLDFDDFKFEKRKQQTRFLGRSGRRLSRLRRRLAILRCHSRSSSSSWLVMLEKHNGRRADLARFEKLEQLQGGRRRHRVGHP